MLGGNPLRFVDLLGLRTLTSGEITILETIFNSKVNFENIDIQSGAGGDPRSWGPIATHHAVTLENTIYFPSSGYKSDFSTANLRSQSWLVHEVGHVYQYQNDSNYSWIKGAIEGLRNDTYKYKLEPEKSFDDYRYEQQAEILRDYYKALKENRPNLKDYEKLLNPKGLGKNCF